MVDMGEPPLIVGPHRICSSELMALLLKGVASGNFGAQNATNTAGNDWPPALGKGLGRPVLCCKMKIYRLQCRQETEPVPCAVVGVGMLSSSELEGSMTICNTLKSPTQPVWV